MRTIAVLLLLTPALTFAQSRGAIRKVILSCQPPDSVSTMVCSALRDKLATNPRYKLSYDNSDDVSTWKMSIIAMDPDKLGDGPHVAIRTILSIVLTKNNTLWSHWLRACGSDKVDPCVATIFSSMDADIEEVFDALEPNKK